MECATVGNLERCLIAATPTPLTMIRSERDGRLIKTKVETHRKPCASLGKTALQPLARRWRGAAAPEGAADACRNTFPRLRGRVARAVLFRGGV